MRGVEKSYVSDKPPALADVNVEIEQGEFVFLVGHSGSGKSTFIRLLLREIHPTKGQIVVADQDLNKLKNWKVPYLRRNIGCVFQDFKLLPNKTSYENVAFALEVIGRSRHVIRTQVPEVLRLVGLEEEPAPVAIDRVVLEERLPELETKMEALRPAAKRAAAPCGFGDWAGPGAEIASL